MKTKWGRFCAAAVMLVSSLAVVPTTAGASEKCLGRTQTPVTVGVAGEPVATTPLLQAYVCRDDTTEQLDPEDLPNAWVEDRSGYYWDPELGWNRYHSGQAVNVYVPAGASISHLRVTYTVGTSTQSTTIPIGIGGGSGRTICVLYVGDVRANPGGCQLYVEQ